MIINGYELRWLRENGQDHIADAILFMMNHIVKLEDRLAIYEGKDAMTKRPLIN